MPGATAAEWDTAFTGVGPVAAAGRTASIIAAAAAVLIGVVAELLTGADFPYAAAPIAGGARRYALGTLSDVGAAHTREAFIGASVAVVVQAVTRFVRGADFVAAPAPAPASTGLAALATLADVRTALSDEIFVSLSVAVIVDPVTLLVPWASRADARPVPTALDTGLAAEGAGPDVCSAVSGSSIDAVTPLVDPSVTVLVTTVAVFGRHCPAAPAGILFALVGAAVTVVVCTVAHVCLGPDRPVTTAPAAVATEAFPRLA